MNLTVKNLSHFKELLENIKKGGFSGSRSGIDDPIVLQVGNMSLSEPLSFENLNGRNIVIQGDEDNFSAIEDAGIDLSVQNVDNGVIELQPSSQSVNQIHDAQYPLLSIDGETRAIMVIENLTFNFNVPNSVNSAGLLFMDPFVYNWGTAPSYIQKGSIIVFKWKWLENRFYVTDFNEASYSITLNHRFEARKDYSWEVGSNVSIQVDIINPKISDSLITPGTYIVRRQEIGSTKSVSIHYKQSTPTEIPNPTSHDFKSHCLNTLINITNSSNITYQNILFRNKGASLFAHQESHVQAEEDSKPCIAITGSSHITFNNCNFTQLLGYCVSVNGEPNPDEVLNLANGFSVCSQIQITNCHVYNTYGGGFHLNYCDHCNVEGNIIEHIGLLQHESVGVLQRRCCNDNNINSNTIHHTPYSGISLGWSWVDHINQNEDNSSHDNKVTGNHVHHCMMVLNDGAGIYHLGKDCDTFISNNDIHDINYNQGYEAYAVYLDEATHGVTCEKNLCYRCPCLLMIHRTGNCEIRNNIFASSLDKTIWISFLESDENRIPYVVPLRIFIHNNIIRQENGISHHVDYCMSYLIKRNLLDDRGNNVRAFPEDSTYDKNWYYGSLTPLLGSTNSYLSLNENGVVVNGSTLPHLNINNFRIFGTVYTDFQPFPLISPNNEDSI